MNFGEIVKVCEKHLSDNWSTTEIAFDNADFDVPTDAWLRCFLRPVLTENVALGGLAKRDYASFWIQVFIPLNIGSGLAYEYAAILEALFSNIVIDGVNFYAAETHRVGDEGNGWFQLNVRAQCWAQSNC